jgi:hypothetical protein
MLSIAQLAHHRDPEAIAEIIRQKLQRLDLPKVDKKVETESLDADRFALKHLEVKVAIDDSSLDLQIHTESALDKEKLLTLIRDELQNLHIESVAKVRVHCWRNNEEIDAEIDEEIDEEINEQQPLWTGQFMLEPQSFPYQGLTLDSEMLRSPEIQKALARSPETRSPETRSPEPQLSKHSVLQQAIAQISASSNTAKTHLLVDEFPPIDDFASDFVGAFAAGKSPDDHEIKPSISELKAADLEQYQAAIDNNYWQFLLVGLSIVLLGLGIGAIVKAVTINNLTEPTPVSSSPSIETAPTAPNKITPSQSNNLPPSTTTDPPNNPTTKSNPYSSLETPTPSPNASEPPLSPSPLASAEERTVVTLEKFNLIQKGMTIEQVEKVLGASGKIIAETNTVDTVGRVYSWKNPEGSNAIVEFKDGLVVAKAQAGL